jgi:hypothetical protein
LLAISHKVEGYCYLALTRIFELTGLSSTFVQTVGDIGEISGD